MSQEICLELDTKLFKKKDFIEKEAYDKLVKSYSNLEKHCILLELATQLNQEIFQKENSGENLNAPTFNQLFEINELKAQSQEKDTFIRKLKEKIKSLSGKDSMENVKKDIDEIETISIKLEHINAKSVENLDLNAQLQEKVFAITALKNELRKLKRKNVVNTVVSKPNATLASGMFKINIEPISPRLKKQIGGHETCPNSPKPSEKLVAVTSFNKDKRVRFAEPVTSSKNIPKQTDSLKTKDSNKPLLTSTGVKPTTSASGSKPSGNTKNNRIRRSSVEIERIIGLYYVEWLLGPSTDFCFLAQFCDAYLEVAISEKHLLSFENRFRRLLQSVFYQKLQRLRTGLFGTVRVIDLNLRTLKQVAKDGLCTSVNWLDINAQHSLDRLSKKPSDQKLDQSYDYIHTTLHRISLGC
ncbi:hypothetical protein Tco_0697789 [Tanacetum coccineum]